VEVAKGEVGDSCHSDADLVGNDVTKDATSEQHFPLGNSNNAIAMLFWQSNAIFDLM
jgi:hypothetical protein